MSQSRAGVHEIVCVCVDKDMCVCFVAVQLRESVDPHIECVVL